MNYGEYTKHRSVIKMMACHCDNSDSMLRTLKTSREAFPTDDAHLECKLDIRANRDMRHM